MIVTEGWIIIKKQILATFPHLLNPEYLGIAERFPCCVLNTCKLLENKNLFSYISWANNHFFILIDWKNQRTLSDDNWKYLEIQISQSEKLYWYGAIFVMLPINDKLTGCDWSCPCCLQSIKYLPFGHYRVHFQPLC